MESLNGLHIVGAVVVIALAVHYGIFLPEDADDEGEE